jgi:hypothetical protein
MKKRRYSKIKKNLLVRFIRWIYKLLDTFFKRKKSTFRSTYRGKLSTEKSNHLERSVILDSDDHPDNRPDNRSISVGELFDRVKWKFPEATNIQDKPLSSRIPQPHDISRN